MSLFNIWCFTRKCANMKCQLTTERSYVICISFTYHILIQFDFYRTHLTYCSSQSTPDFMWQVWCFTLPMLQRRVCQQVLGAIYQRRAGEQINREAFASWWTQYKHINWYKHYDMTWHDIKVWVSDLVEIWQCTATIAPYIALYIYSTSVAEKSNNTSRSPGVLLLFLDTQVSPAPSHVSL